VHNTRVGVMRAPEADRRAHWDARYQASGPDGVSWFQDRPVASLALIAASGLDRASALIDVGGGAARLVDHLLADGWSDVTVLDLSVVALNQARMRIGPSPRVQWIAQDLLTWRPARRYDLWHDRAVFHFLVNEDDRRQYGRVLSEALTPQATVIVGAFASDGPTHCSGLPVARYDSEALVSALGGRFDVLAARREGHVTPQGKTQSFTWVALRRH
jgi:trans-aconitate methyltransferase